MPKKKKTKKKVKYSTQTWSDPRFEGAVIDWVVAPKEEIQYFIITK